MKKDAYSVFFSDQFNFAIDEKMMPYAFVISVTRHNGYYSLPLRSVQMEHL